MAKTDFDKLFHDFGSIRIGVLGDVMLDTYWWGHVDRISPEAPVPVVALDRKELRIGGAGNVALNLVSLGAPATILSVMGQDDDGSTLKELFAARGIDTGYLVERPSRVTTNKSRIISRNQQMMRLDSEMTKDLGADDENALLDMVDRFIREQSPRVIIFEDYNKGVLTERVISEVVHRCRKQGIITAVDPKRRNFFSFRDVDLFKPNLKEVKDGLNLLADRIDLPFLQEVHQELGRKLKHRISLITLSEKGIFYSDSVQQQIVPSHIRNIADVSGAGDTVIAVAALVYAATGDIELMAEIANIAGGLVCESVGTVAIDRNQLLAECRVLIG